MQELEQWAPWRYDPFVIWIALQPDAVYQAIHRDLDCVLGELGACSVPGWLAGRDAAQRLHGLAAATGFVEAAVFFQRIADYYDGELARRRVVRVC